MHLGYDDSSVLLEGDSRFGRPYWHQFRLVPHLRGSDIPTASRHCEPDQRAIGIRTADRIGLHRCSFWLFIRESYCGSCSWRLTSSIKCTRGTAPIPRGMVCSWRCGRDCNRPFVVCALASSGVEPLQEGITLCCKEAICCTLEKKYIEETGLYVIYLHLAKHVLPCNKGHP